MSVNEVIEHLKALSQEERTKIRDFLRAYPDSAKESSAMAEDQDWSEFVNASFGCLKDDPMERPEQPILEERESLK